mmetsp:Transcript_9502/g.12500  ORF Transcript_9502/g.12500 Transcript_9502/m.12500 type:complete len:920 (-) Transcript_9502:219-2978(-)
MESDQIPINIKYTDDPSPPESTGKRRSVGFGGTETQSGSGGGLAAIFSAFSHNSKTDSTLKANEHSYREPIPQTLFYRDNATSQPGALQRPKLTDLLSGLPQIKEEGGGEVKADGELDASGAKPSDGDKPQQSGYSFGMWEGVFIRCLLNIWGVMMFLRLTWVVGEAGIGMGTLVVAFSVVVTTITTVSLSAICTNGEVQAGGAYFMISRSLGPEFGASIGITFYAANSISIAMYLIGFAEALGIVMGSSVMAHEDWDERLFALMALCLLMGVAFLGGSWEIQAQKVLLVVMLGAIASYFIGTLMNRKDANKGQTGFSGATFADNWGPDYSEGESWMSVFGVFFPAVTGIMAGANISGDLADPQKAIPRGTLLAIGWSTFVYVLMAWFLGSTITREFLKDFTTQIAVVEISVWGPIVYAGIFAATLSSALAQLIGAPRILMSVARDDIFPFLRFFKLGVGKNDEPLRGYALTFAIAVAAIMGGDLNSVSPLITNFFLASYAMVNYACFASSMVKSPSWRPTYTAYNPYGALVGAVLCFIVMLMVDWIAAAITVVLCLLLYKYVDWVKPDVNWGSAGQAWRYLSAVQNLHKLEQTKQHVKTFRPQYLVLCGNPQDRDHLIRFSSQLSEGSSAVIAGNVILGSFDENVSAYHEARNTKHLIENRYKAFLDVVVAPTLLLGVESLLQLSGMSHLRPNTVIMGFKKQWDECEDEMIEEYVKVIQASFGMGMGVCVLRGVERLLDASSSDLQQSGTLDVWWLVDDGGLTILLPYLLSLHGEWKNCKLRLITVAKKSKLSDEQTRMTRLLRKFRIKAELVVVDKDDREDPLEETIAEYSKLAGKKIDTSEIRASKDGSKSFYFMRLSELLHQHSANANMIVVSLPVPRQDIKPRRYMAYLELLSRNLPPMLLMRGNNESVLTFYS